MTTVMDRIEAASRGHRRAAVPTPAPAPAPAAALAEDPAGVASVATLDAGLTAPSRPAAEDAAPTRERHHPSVRRGRNGWWWSCPCGASGCRGGTRARWTMAYVQALAHASGAR